MDIARIARELEWLKAHPEFDEMPATIEEFLGSEYLNVAEYIRPGLKKALVDIFGEEVNADRISAYEKAMITGAVGIGKTTFASIAIPYMVHHTLCLRNPQQFYGLLDGARIAFMQMSTSSKQALEVIFGDLKARIENSAWYRDNYPHDPSYTKQMRFPKDIWVLPGSSTETSYEGYNILGGILDEMDSHQITDRKDYADEGFNTIESRIASRFTDFSDLNNMGHRGLIICIGQMKKSNGFAKRKYDAFLKDPKAYVMRMTIWESFGWGRYTHSDGIRASFWYDTKTKKIIPGMIAQHVSNNNLIEIPNAYRSQFENAPEKALRDLAGVPPVTADAFISLVDRIEECSARWVERVGYDSPVKPNPSRVEFEDWFKGGDPRKRTLHIDFAKSGDGDALGMAMGYVDHLVDIEGEEKPYIIIDALMRIKASSGTEIFFSDVRNVIYYLKFDLNFRLKHVTMDGFQCFSADTKVPLLDGRTLSLGELAERYPRGGVWTYSIKNGKIVPGEVTKAWRTGRQKVIKVELDNGEVIRCTATHRFMLRNGEYLQARLLKPGDSLMPLYRRVVDTSTGHMDNYEQVGQFSQVGVYWQYTHRMVKGTVPQGFVIHHDNHDHFDNSPENLYIISRSQHSAHHNMRQYWTNDRRTAVSSAISKSNTELVGLDSRARRHDVTLTELESVMHLPRRAVTHIYGWSQDMIYARVREAGYTGWSDFKKNHLPNNHKVAFVSFEETEVDVYDLQIKDLHNFALDAGVFVHNSTDTHQQLRKRRFEVDYISADKSTLPYEDLRDAIYERRIEFPKFMTYLRKGDTELVEIAVSEIMQLIDTGKKIDHPPDGSKDIADAIACVTTTLMGDRSYRRGIRSDVQSGFSQFDENLEATGTTGKVLEFPGRLGLQAPVPQPSGNPMGLYIPDRLKPRGR
jgi:hypothetical protein